MIQLDDIKDFAFTGNPIMISEQGGVSSYSRFEIQIGTRKVYCGKFTSPLSIDIADIVDSFVPHIPEIPNDNVNPFVEVESMTQMSDRLVSFRLVPEDGASGAAESVSFYALPGGISRQHLRVYADSGVNVFDARFLNPRANFFLTTKNSGWLIKISEKEAGALYFIAGPDDYELRVTESISGRHLSFEINGLGIYALDVNAMRRRFFDCHNVLSACFDVYRNNSFACRIVIAREYAALEEYCFRYRNSFGVFDKLMLAGELMVTQAVLDKENIEIYGKYNRIIGSVSKQRERVSYEKTFSIDTILRSSLNINALLDMLASDEVYLVNSSGLSVRVIPSAENLSFRVAVVAPLKISLKFEAADYESNLMPDIINVFEPRRKRIFSNQFNSCFN